MFYSQQDKLDMLCESIERCGYWSLTRVQRDKFDQLNDLWNIGMINSIYPTTKYAGIDFYRE